MAYNPPRTAEQFEAMRAFFARDIAQASVALSQFVRERNIRMMGAIRSTGDTPPDQIRMVQIAQKVVNVAWAYLSSYFVPIFARYWRIRARLEKEGNERKLHKLTMRLMYFSAPYSLYEMAHEAGMTVFDMKFDQYHTISAMLGIEKDKDEEDEATKAGLTLIAADPERMRSKVLGEQIAKHEVGFDPAKKLRFPTFGEAIMLAKDLMDIFADTKATLPTVAEATKKIVHPAPKTTKDKKKPAPAPTREEEVLLPNGNRKPDGDRLPRAS